MFSPLSSRVKQLEAEQWWARPKQARCHSVCLWVPLTLGRLFLLQVAVAVGRGQAVFLQVPADAEAGPPHAALTFEPWLVQRVHHREHALVALDAICCCCCSGGRLSLRGTEVSAGVKGVRFGVEWWRGVTCSR